MIRRKAIASLVGVVAAACLVVSVGGAGAAGGAPSGAEQAATVRPVGVGIAVLRKPHLSTRVEAFRYLRAIGVDPKHVVIQRGRRNYAGPHCPGKGWTCTKGTRVLQAGSANVAQCTPGTLSSPLTGETDCLIVQVGGGIATCALRSSSGVVGQKCDITQTNTATSAGNTANVVEIVSSIGPSGDQEASQTARITQLNSGGGSNVATVQQQAVQSFNASNVGNAPISQTQGVNQFAQVTQDTCALVSGVCTRTSGPGDNTSNVSQAQNQQEHANSGAALTQLQNTNPTSGTCDDNANACYVVKQTSASGANTTGLGQALNQLEETTHMTGGRQAQGSLGDPFAGGLDHTFEQSSAGGGLSTQTSTQQERQTQHNDSAEIVTSQVGPTRKGVGRQSGNANDTANQSQSAQQMSNGSGAAGDVELLTDECHSSGNCSAQQQVNSNGSVSTISRSGSSISLLTTCGGTCTSSPPIVVDCTVDPDALTTALASPSLADGTTLVVRGICKGPFEIGHNLTLVGSSGSATLDGQNEGTALTVDAGKTVVLSHLTITGGSNTTAIGSAVGGIHNLGTLTLEYSSVSGNSAASAGADVGGATGGIENEGPTLTLTHSSVNGNSGTVVRGFSFGGIFGGGTMTLTDSTVSGNTATATGLTGTRVARAGIEFTGTTMTITGSSVSGNSASAPSNASGGILAAFGPLTIVNSTVSGNSASSDGGAVGGIANLTQVTLANSRVSGNSATSTAGPAAGGISNRGTAALTNSSVSENSASSQTGTAAVGGIVNFVSENAAATIRLTDSSVSGNSASAPAGVAVGGISNRSPATITLTNSPVVNNVPTNCDFSDIACGT